MRRRGSPSESPKPPRLARSAAAAAAMMLARSFAGLAARRLGRLAGGAGAGGELRRGGCARACVVRRATPGGHRGATATAASAAAVAAAAAQPSRTLSVVAAGGRGGQGRGGGRGRGGRGGGRGGRGGRGSKNDVEDAPQRLAKAMAQRGVASRRASEQMVFDGRVKVNGEPVHLPQHMVTLADEITVDGKKVGGDLKSDPNADRKIYILVNKPKGYVCSAVSENSAQPVTSLLKDFVASWEAAAPAGAAKLRLFNVGRLDVNTTGMLLMTNDGAFANAVSHPSNGVLKEYSVLSSSKLTRRQLEAIAAGTTVDGAFVVPVAVRQEDDNQVVVQVAEGRNREVRVLCEAAGVYVKRLKRISIGNLSMPSGLGLGAFRVLKVEELRRMGGRAAPTKAKMWSPWEVERRIQRGERARRGMGDPDIQGTRQFRQARDRRGEAAGARESAAAAADSRDADADIGGAGWSSGGAGWSSAGADAARGARVGRRPRRPT